jgi:polyisoprenoid-binding protein YceI
MTLRHISCTVAAALIAAAAAQPVMAAEMIVIREADMPMPQGIAEAAARAGVTVREVDASAGVPEEVVYLPALAYLGEHGAQLFAGDPYDAAAVGRFIDTASRTSVPPMAREFAVRWPAGNGGGTYPLAVVIDQLRGDVPANSGSRTLAGEISLLMPFLGTRSPEPLRTAQFGRADWHWRIIPRRSRSGAYTLQLAVFSPFDRYNPAWQNGEAPLTGNWDEREALHREAADILDREMRRLVESPGAGCVHRQVERAPVLRWEDLGASPRTGRNLTIPARWAVIADPSIATPVEFRFPHPLSEIFGGAAATSGTLTLGANGLLAPAEATVTVPLSAIRMDRPELDATVQTVAKAVDFPVASFVLDSVTSPDPNLMHGVPTEFAAQGALTLAGRTATVPVNVRAELYLTASGAPRILADATFDVNIREAFGLEGPDGPEPERDTLEFRVRLLLAPE